MNMLVEFDQVHNNNKIYWYLDVGRVRSRPQQPQHSNLGHRKRYKKMNLKATSNKLMSKTKRNKGKKRVEQGNNDIFIQ